MVVLNSYFQPPTLTQNPLKWTLNLVIGFTTNEFHEFWCLFICRRAFVEIHIKGPKIYKRTKYKYHS